MRNAIVTGRSQVSMLNAQLAEAGISHNADARIDLPMVRVAGRQVFFCNVGEIRLASAYNRLGDGGPLPTFAQVTGLFALKEGEEDFLDMFNVRVITNGRVHLVVDSKTKLVPA